MEVFDTHQNANWFIRVLRLLSLTCVDEAFGVHATVDAAVASIERRPEAVASRRPEPGGRSDTRARVLSGSSG